TMKRHAPQQSYPAGHAGQTTNRRRPGAVAARISGADAVRLVTNAPGPAKRGTRAGARCRDLVLEFRLQAVKASPPEGGTPTQGSWILHKTADSGHHASPFPRGFAMTMSFQCPDCA